MAGPSTSIRMQDVEDIWNKLHEGLDCAYRREPMSSQFYMSLYTCVYNYCTSITLASTNKRDLATQPLASSGRVMQADFVGHEMYRRVKEYVIKYVTNVREHGRELHGEDLLQYYTSEWLNFRISSKVMDGIFSYLNRHWIRRELDEGHEDIYMIYTLALMLWKEYMFNPLRERVIEAILNLIKKERMGDCINTRYVSGVVECLVELGIDEYEASENAQPASRKPEADKLAVYREAFEKKFLAHTKEFYEQETSEFMQRDGSVVEYMVQVEKRLEEEDTRCQLYLNLATRTPLAKCCEEVLISRRLEFFQSEFGNLLTQGQDADLGRMFQLCDRVENGLDNLRSALEKYITKEGLDALAKVANEAYNDARLYIKTILDVHQRYQVLVQQSFGSDPGFMQALDKAATNFINANMVTKKAPNNMTNSKSAELLARYCDQLLRKSSKMPEERELEEMLTKNMIVFKYIDDKDIFLKYHTKMFSKRLINEVSASDEAEASFISKLKGMCGYEYTSRLSKMVNDTQISKDLTSEFASKKLKLGMEYQALLLTSGSWPPFATSTLNLPPKLSESIEHFTEYYNTKFSGRKLTWIYSQSRGEISALCYSKKYVFTCTTAQMTTILLFNEQTSYTVEKIIAATGMDSKNASAVIFSLIKNDVVKADKEVSGDEIDGSVTISLNTGYTNRKVRVDLSKMSVKMEAPKEIEAVYKNVDEDRKNVINACIVRIMKTRKTIQHQQLMTEVLQQLSVRFKPRVEMIKRGIGSMIEKEYMRRSAENKDIYEYMS